MTAEAVPTDPNHKISRTIKALLAYDNRTYEELATAIGLKRSTIYNRMACHNDWTATEVALAADWLRVPVQTLFDGLDLPDSPGFRTGSFSMWPAPRLHLVNGGNDHPAATNEGETSWTPSPDATSSSSNCDVRHAQPSTPDADSSPVSRRLAVVR